jgi:hypothetical protein
MSVLGGVYNGSITFFDHSNKSNYIWFTVLMQIERADPQKKIDLTSQVRKPLVVDILLYNPESVALDFNVVI